VGGDAALRIWMGEGGGGEWVVTRHLAFAREEGEWWRWWLVMRLLVFVREEWRWWCDVAARVCARGVAVVV
jgi:hypothetical protein